MNSLDGKKDFPRFKICNKGIKKRLLFVSLKCYYSESLPDLVKGDTTVCLSSLEL